MHDGERHHKEQSLGTEYGQAVLDGPGDKVRPQRIHPPVRLLELAQVT